ncbi:serine/threonine protein kinase [Aeoliella sp. ICT_H6.2]|uniref:non-specific serine/threonine protein kinase n=1 Tax=Aeoliella straminimaris TaxID=2954799 RepID=A0A9X2JGM4_9BACT|nr:serine/threonine-protein kinase [Aeoliella straminimaris]MCO6043723.1 serine/threonine protein kinase [Aeoliella straminimaris]
MDFTQLGPYKIGPRLGKGGMGSVYRGENVETHQVAAIKALAPQLATSEGFRERFEAEIESLKTLRHEGIVRLYGYGEEKGTLFYAMELVEGHSLEEELKAGRRFNWREVVDIAIQVCKALKHAHDHGIIHRDIKPANILLDKEEHVKLADFGIARLFGGTQLTMAGGVLGTADYMAPEQADGRPVTERCDQYSLGCVMYALLAGRPPFRAKSLPEMLQLQRFAEPEPVRRYAPEAPEQLEYCIGQLLKKDPADRFPNTLVLARHLEAMRRALSRPFDVSQPMPGEIPESPPPPVPPVSLGATRPNTAQQPVSDLGESIDIEVVPTSLRNAETIDSTETPEPAATDLAGPSYGHFTEVGPDRGHALPVFTPSMWAAAIGLVAMVLAAVWLVYQLTRPYDADTLYQIIHAENESPTVDELRSHSGEVDQFVSRFPDDPRADQMREYQDELALDREQRRFEAIARGRGDDRGLLTAERLYLSALQKAERDPRQAAAELTSLVGLFGSGDLDAEPAEQDRIAAVVELARRRLEKLDLVVARQSDIDLATISARLDAAEQLQGQDAEQAKAICNAVIQLYHDQPWAADMVDRAEHLLEEMQK